MNRTAVAKSFDIIQFLRPTVFYDVPLQLRCQELTANETYSLSLNVRLLEFRKRKMKSNTTLVMAKDMNFQGGLEEFGYGLVDLVRMLEFSCNH